MTFKTAISSTQISLRSLARIANALEPSGCYTVCELAMPPAFVLARMFDVLGILDPVAHARLTAAGGPYRAIPDAALDDAFDPWWSGPAGGALLGGLVDAINAATKPQYVCVLEADGRIALAPLRQWADVKRPEGARLDGARHDGPRGSGFRAAVRPQT